MLPDGVMFVLEQRVVLLLVVALLDGVCRGAARRGAVVP